MMPQSPSSLSVFNQCPAKYESQYITKTYIHDTSEALEEGNRFHKAVENAIKEAEPLPEKYKFMQGLVDVLLKYKRKGYSVMAEERVAIDKDHKPVAFFSKQGMLRCIIDVIVIKGDTAVVIDWKTGKNRDYNEQKAINIECAKAVYGVSKVHTIFAFVKYDEVDRFYVSEVGHYFITKMYAELEKLREAYATGNFPPVPSGLCKAWCGNMQCEFNGKR